MNILVTGGAGFVGSNVAVFLKTTHPSWQIYVLDNLSRRGSELNLLRLQDHNINFVHGDIRNPEDFFALKSKNINFLIECSAEPSVLAGLDGNSLYLVKTNLYGLINCLEFCAQTKANLIFLSTSRVYPYTKINKLPIIEKETRFCWQEFKAINEDFPLDGPRTLYGATKLAGELFIQEYANLYGFKSVINRFGVIAGPWQFGKVDQGVFTLWMLAHYFQKELKYIGFGGTGKQVRDLLHVQDACTLIEWELLNIDQINQQTFNVGGGLDINLSLLETTQICAEITGNKIPVGSDPMTRPGDIKIYITDNSKVQTTTGWQPKHSARQILVDIFNWIKTNEKLLKKLN